MELSQRAQAWRTRGRHMHMAAAKRTDGKRIKNFFKLISLDLADKVKAEIGKGIDPNVRFSMHGGPELTLRSCTRSAEASPGA